MDGRSTTRVALVVLIPDAPAVKRGRISPRYHDLADSIVMVSRCEALVPEGSDLATCVNASLVQLFGRQDLVPDCRASAGAGLPEGPRTRAEYIV